MSRIVPDDHATLLTLFGSKLLLHIASEALQQCTATRGHTQSFLESLLTSLGIRLESI